MVRRSSRSRRPVGARGAGTALAILIAGALGACVGSGYTYVANDDLGTYFRVPAGYQVFDAEEVLQPVLDRNPGVDPETVMAQQWAVTFDGGDEPAVDRFLSQLASPADDLAGFARVRNLSPQERETYSLRSLRTELLTAQQLQQLGDRVELLDSQELSQEGGEGVRMTVSVDGPSGTLIFEQMTLVDDRTSRVYLLALGCEADCYEASRGDIAAITESWTIEER
jgi:hypothetical protein